MKGLGGVIVIILVALVGIHGYMQSRFNTMEPCKAAVERIKQDKKKGGILDQILGEAISLGQNIDANRMAIELQNQQGISGCYQIALFGSE